MDSSPILLMVTPFDMGYVPTLKPLLKGRRAYVIDQDPDTHAEIQLYANSKGIKYIITTNPKVLNHVVESQRHQSLDNWAGSLYERSGITYLFLNPLRQLYSVPYGRFLAERFISKIVQPTLWPRTPGFSWELLRIETCEKWYHLFSQTLVIAVDIETVSFENPSNGELETVIRCIAFTGLWPDSNIHTIVIPILDAPKNEQAFWIAWMRKFMQLKIGKIFQNGLYDNAHLISYSSPGYGYFWDTQSLFHSWYSELPKNLAFISAFTIHSIFYWKDLAKETGKIFEYNARDGWATLVSFLGLIRDMPQWTWNNYYLKFPIWAPCLYANLEGVKVNESTHGILCEQYITEFKTIRTRLRKWFGEEYNPNSPTQTTKIIQFYGSPDIPNADEAALDKFALRHPLNARFARELLAFKSAATILSKSLKPKNFSVSEKPTKKKTYLTHYGRFYYSHNPDGTDTLRLSSGEGYNWTGSNIQNQDPRIKEMYEPD
jgi:hypothetical protein